jgi:hypothetical protein
MKIMNKKKYAVLILVALAIFLFYRQAETKSVLNVLNQRNDAVLNSMRIVRRNGVETRTRFNINRRYVNELYKIDTSHCPKKFQLAWLDYVQACERAQKIPGRVIADIAVVAATGSFVPVLNEIPKTVNTNDELLMAWQSLERVALEYDVRIIHQS